MTLQDLIAEGRALERPCWFLSTDGRGKPVGVWHSSSKGETRRWLTVEASLFAGIGSRYISVLSKSSDGGAVELLDHLPESNGGEIDLVVREASVLPPIDAVFALGSDSVGSWLADNQWQRDWGYNSNFSASDLVQQYERIFQSEYPLYLSSNVVAMIGGWHFPFPDDDWRDLIADELLLMTLKDAEPWVEAWRARDGSFKVVERIT
ncbi:MAG: hypothetical protein AB7T08_07635 [Hyphomonadaceae bacterium]